MNDTLNFPNCLVELNLNSVPKHKVAIEPLSYGQQALWFLQQLEPDSPAYNNVHAARIPIALDVDAYRWAFQKLIDRHPALRTTFTTINRQPVRQVHSDMEVSFIAEDASTWSQARLNDRLCQEIYRPFNLEQGPLLRAAVFSRSPHDHIALLVQHHIITDMWSLAILMHELGTFYTAEITGSSAPLKPLTRDYTDFVHGQSEFVNSPDGERACSYWQEQLAGELPVLNLPTDRPRPATPSYRGACQSIWFSQALSTGLKALAKSQDISLQAVALAAFQTLLFRYTGQQDILVGSPRANRNRKVARLIGYFINPIVLRANLSGNPTFSAFSRQVQQTLSTSLEHGDYPYPLLVERLQPSRSAEQSALFQVMFAWQKTNRLLDKERLTAFTLNESGTRLQLGELLIESLRLEQWISPFDLTLLMTDTGDRLAAAIEYNTELFDSSTIDRMLGHYQVLLQSIVANPDQSVSQLPILTAAEEQQLLVTWNSASTEPTGNFVPVHQLFEAQAQQHPEAPALQCEGQVLTYVELNQRANQLARQLQHIGVTPNTPVGLYAERSLDVIIGFLAILKAGGAYLPLDPDLPPERLAFILADARVPVVLTQQHLQGNLVAFEGTVVDLKAVQHQPGPFTGNPTTNITGQQSAYIIYTSGSTGQPKGVLVSHQALAEHCLTIIDHYQLTSKDRVLQFAAFSFDQSIEQILPTLLAGAALIVRGPDIWPPEDFPRLVANLGLTVINLPPAYWAQVAKAWTQAKNASINHALRLVIIGGDVISPKSLRWWHQALGSRSIRLLNAYGPTETTITALTYDIPQTDRNQTSSIIPIGRPLPGRKLFILDESGQPTPVGVPGELYLGGGCLAEGYLNRPDLTAEKFINDPFSPDPTARLYRTGDLGRYRPDGTVEFLGRVDQQVKIRGFRLELGEIQAALSQHPHVREVAVITKQVENGSLVEDKQLVAYIVPPENVTPVTDGLRDFLQQRLPIYMIPGHYVILSKLPLTTSGKVDRRALPAPDNQHSDLVTDYVAPSNPVEAELAQIWSEVLGLDRIGVRNNFFDLGGHSLLATQLVARLRQTFQIDLPLRQFFTTPTIAGMADLVAKQMVEQTSENELAHILDELEDLSSDAIEALLTATGINGRY